MQQYQIFFFSPADQQLNRFVELVIHQKTIETDEDFHRYFNKSLLNCIYFMHSKASQKNQLQLYVLKWIKGDFLDRINRPECGKIQEFLHIIATLQRFSDDDSFSSVQECFCKYIATMKWDGTYYQKEV